MKKVSDEIKQILTEFKEKEITVGKIISEMSERSYGFLLILISLPSALPVPAPGYSTPLGIIILFLGVRLLFKKELWLPKRIMNKSLSKSLVSFILNKGIPFLKKIEYFTKPRLVRIIKNNFIHTMMAVIVILCAISMIIAVPLTNTAPAFAIFLIGLSLVNEDGLLLILGIITGIIALTISTLVLISLFLFGKASLGVMQKLIK